MTVEPSDDLDIHTHLHSVMALITEGEFTMTWESGDTTYWPGDWYESLAGTPHAERIGSEGVTVLLAKN